MKYTYPIIKKLLLITVVLCLLCSCQNHPQEQPAQPHSEIQANTDNAKITLGAYHTEHDNPLLSQTGYNEQMHLLIYDSLYLVNPKFEAEENLAIGYQIHGNGYFVDIEIKENVFFHDGSELTAHDVAATIQYILNYGGYYQHQLRNVKNVSVNNKQSIRLELKYLTPNLKLQLSFPVVCKKELLNSSEFRYNGTGPYRVTSVTAGKQILLEKNTHYHRNYETDISQIEIALIPDQETARSLSGSGILDAFYAAFFDEGLKTITKYESKKLDYITDEYTFVALNYNVALTQEKKFRKALYSAVNRDKICEEVFMTHAQSTYLPLPPASWAYNNSADNQKKIEESKHLLSELGYSDVDNNGILERYDNDVKQELVLDILSTDDAIKKAICENLIVSLKEIGIALKAHYVPLEEFETVYHEKVHDLYLITTNIGYDLDLSAFFDGVFATPVNIPFAQYQEKFANTDKLELKQPDYMRLCDEFYENIPHIPLVFLNNTMIISNKLQFHHELYPSYLYYGILKK